MKNIVGIFAIAIATVISPLGMAESATEGQSAPAPKKISAPNGGRVIVSVEPNIEFLVATDRKIRISLLDKDGKIIPATDQTVSAICGDRMKPTNLEFSVQSGVLVSNKPLPEGESVPIILKIRTAKDGPFKSIKFTIKLEICGSCNKQEYACICGCVEQ